jgi:very-short-patch-repair endonuclease
MIESEKNIKSGIVFLQRVSGQKVRMSRHLRKNMTPAELLFWNEVRNRKLGGFKFRRQQIIKGFIADFFCESAKVAVEIDGPVHQEEKQKRSDAHKDTVCRNRGIKVIRFSNDAVMNEIDHVKKTLLRILQIRVSEFTRRFTECLPPSPGGEGAGDEVIDTLNQQKGKPIQRN